MKILIIRTFPGYMNVRKNTYNIQEIGLAKALIRKGHICDIVFWTDKSPETVSYKFDGDKELKIFYLNGKNILNNAIYKGLDELIAQYDIIQPAEHNQIYSAILAKKYPQKTIVYHGPYYCDFNKRYNLLCRATDLFTLPIYKKHNTPFIAKSRLAKEFLISKGIKENRISVCGVGIDADAFLKSDFSEIPPEISRISSIECGIKLLYIGKIEPRRNCLFLIDVLNKLREKGINAVLVAVGNGKEDYCQSFENHIAELELEDYVYRIKAAEQKYLSYIYQNTDVFLLPTIYEIFGMVLLEAMYFGKPVITTQNGGSDMLIQNGKTGITEPEFNAEKWAEDIILATKNKELGKNAAEHIKSNCTWELLADKFIKAYKSI